MCGGQSSDAIPTHTCKARQRPAFSECEAAWVWAGQAEQGHRLTRTTTTAVNARCQPLLEAPAACGAPIDRFDGRHRQRHKHTRGTAGGEAALSSNNDDDPPNRRFCVAERSSVSRSNTPKERLRIGIGCGKSMDLEHNGSSAVTSINSIHFLRVCASISGRFCSFRFNLQNSRTQTHCC